MVRAVAEDVRPWIRAMTGTDDPASSIMWENLCILHGIFSRECTYCNFPNNTFEEISNFLTEVGALSKSRKITDSRKARALIHEVLVTHDNANDCLGTKSEPIQLLRVDICRIMRVEDFIAFLLPPSWQALYPLGSSDSFDKFADDFLNNASIRRQIEAAIEGTIRGKYRCAFVTKSGDLQGYAIEQIIDKIGVGTAGAVQWMELRYPKNFVDSVPLKRATILGAGPNALFRSCRPSTDGWGMSVDIDNFGHGFPEAIHAEYVIKKGDGFRPTYLGKTMPRQFYQFRELLDFNKKHL